jgi:hypothetical protein
MEGNKQARKERWMGEVKSLVFAASLVGNLQELTFRL